jgi:hypothetical protein
MLAIVNVHDSKATYLLMMVLKGMCSGVKITFVDGEYGGKLIDNTRKEFKNVI